MEPTNFLRKALPIFKDMRANLHKFKTTAMQRRELDIWVDIAPLAQKFCLADNHEFMPGQKSGMKDRIADQELHLPYPAVLIEFRWHDLVSETFPCMVLAHEINGKVVCHFAGYYGGHHDGRSNYAWIVLPVVAGFYCDPALRTGHDLLLADDPEVDPRSRDIMQGAAQSQFQIVMALIDALTCSNVRAEALPVRPTNKAALKRGALPFDAYHVLTVERRNRDGAGSGLPGDHRSPREHMRRGTVVTNRYGTRFWRNGTVVNPGTAGKVTKDYVVRG